MFSLCLLFLRLQFALSDTQTETYILLSSLRLLTLFGIAKVQVSMVNPEKYNVVMFAMKQGLELFITFL